MSFGFDGDYREQVRAIKAEVLSKLNSGNVIGKLVIWVSPMTNKLDRRVAFFIDYTESKLWEDKMSETYDKLGYTYYVYDI